MHQNYYKHLSEENLILFEQNYYNVKKEIKKIKNK